MDISRFVYYLPFVGLFAVDLDCFQCWTIMNNASTYMHMHVLFLLGRFLGVEIFWIVYLTF